MDDLLTLKDIAKRLGVPESNLRYYRNRIGDFLPSAGKGRRRRYFPEAEEIFRKTIEYINEGVTLDRVYAIFAENKPLALSEDIARPAQEELAKLIISKMKEEQGILTDAPAQAVASESNSAILAALENLRKDVQDIKVQAAEAASAANASDEMLLQMRRQLEELDQENRTLREQLAQKETIIEGQKRALVDAREQRRQMAEEIERLGGSRM